MTRTLLITNCRLFNAPPESLTSILVKDGRISQIAPSIPAGPAHRSLDAQGRLVAPGFIDVHIHGAGGADVLDATVEALQTIAKTAARFGTTSFLATTVYKPGQENRHITLAAECTNTDLGGARLLGLHLEGPFINPDKRGMIQPDFLAEPSVQLLDSIIDLTQGKLRMMTIAPELPGTTQLVHRLTAAGIVPSFGHSAADYQQTLDAIQLGICHVTHLYNAMPPIHHRAPGPLLAIFRSPHLTAQIIPDGIHIHPTVLKFTFDLLGPNRLIPITDGIQALGLPDGQYTYNGVPYQVKAGAARYHDGTLVGTALGLNKLLAKFVQFTRCDPAEAIRAVTQNPARLLGIDHRKGTLAPGKDADLVLLEPDLSVHTTIVEGKIVYQRQK